MKTRIATFITVLAILLSVTGTAYAEGEPLPCVGDQVFGTVIAVDSETNTVTVATESGECTVEISDGDYGHPITNLLAAYFGEDSTETLTLALEAATVCAVYDETAETWSSVEVLEGEECPGSELLVTGDNGDGTFNASTAEGDPALLSVEDEEAAMALSESVDGLAADWEITEDGDISDIGDEINALHDAGWGYGELVKVYAIVAESEEACAALVVEETPEDGGIVAVVDPVEEDADDPCAVTVEYLISLLEGGSDMGDLFADILKPSMLGVGHVRMALFDFDSFGDGISDGDSDGGEGDDGQSGVCNARSQGGNANAKGQDINC